MTVNRRGNSRHSCHVVSPPPGFRPETSLSKLFVCASLHTRREVIFVAFFM